MRRLVVVTGLALGALYSWSVAAQEPAAPTPAAPVAPPLAAPGLPEQTQRAGDAPPAIGPPASTTPSAAASESAPQKKLQWRDTWLVWDNSVTAQTLGIGKNFLSSDPTYEMSGSFRPRYYLYDTDLETIYLAGRIDLVHEFTNSDTTTERGETSFGSGGGLSLASDASLLSGYSRKLVSHGDYETSFVVRAPILMIPTSKFSLDNGTILGLGTEVRLYQQLPLAGSKWPVWKTLTLVALAGYSHTFTRAVVPTNPELRRVRLDPEGQSVPGDQLTGGAFPEHELHFDAILLAAIADRLSLFLDFSYRPTWDYGFGTVDICITTGCTPALRPLNPSRFVEWTWFDAEVFYDVIDELTLSLGYISPEIQPGPDGQRRSIFYSPAAQLSFGVTAHLDAIYLWATGQHSASSSSAHIH